MSQTQITTNNHITQESSPSSPTHSLKCFRDVNQQDLFMLLKQVGNSGPRFSPLQGHFWAPMDHFCFYKCSQVLTPFQQQTATLQQSIYSQLGQGTTSPNYQ